MKIVFLSPTDSSHTIKWANSLSEHGIKVLVYGLKKSIKTEFLQSISLNDTKNSRIQLRLFLDNIRKNTLPVYICETELDFPYEETVLQIAKKKLLAMLAS